MWRRFRRFFISLIIIIIVLVGLASWLVAKATAHLLHPPTHPLEDRHLAAYKNPAEFGLKLERVMVSTTDGVKLQGVHVEPAAEPGTAVKFRKMRELMRQEAGPPTPSQNERRGTILMLHGRGGKKEDFFAIAERFCAAGYRCMAFDSRAQGESGGEFVSYGWRERGDIRAILDAMEAQYGTGLRPWGLFGISMGAATGLQTLPGEPRLQAAVVVASYSDMGLQMREVANRHFFRGASVLADVTAAWIKFRTDFDIYAIQPVKAASRIYQPVCVVHGGADSYIPPRHGRDIYAALSHEKKWIEVPGGTHSAVLMTGGDPLYYEMIQYYWEHLPKH